MDGKCLRGARRPDGSRVFLLSAVRHHDAVCAAIREIGAKTNEIPEFAPLLDQMHDTDLTGAIVTMDALHAQRGHATYLVGRGAHYLVTVKNNQRAAADQLRGLPWGKIPVLHRSSDRGHGRQEVRELQVATVTGLLFPHARQVLRIRRKRRRLGAGRWRTQTVYAVTDVPAHQADPAELAGWARGQWIIENQVHWIRDVTFDEDRHQARTGSIPAVLAVVRDIVRATLRLRGWANTAAGRRAHTTKTALTLHGIP